MISSLPYRQLRSAPDDWRDTPDGSLPYRQLRSEEVTEEAFLDSSLPYRQLRRKKLVSFRPIRLFILKWN